jgi:hypothetical protein
MPKPKRWSHQSELDLNIGKEIVCAILNTTDILLGKLIAADQYTIKLEVMDEDSLGKKHSKNLVIFKQAIESFQIKGA